MQGEDCTFGLHRSWPWILGDSCPNFVTQIPPVPFFVNFATLENLQGWCQVSVSSRSTDPETPWYFHHTSFWVGTSSWNSTCLGSIVRCRCCNLHPQQTLAIHLLLFAGSVSSSFLGSSDSCFHWNLTSMAISGLIWSYMVQYLHFRILEFPLITGKLCHFLKPPQRQAPAQVSRRIGQWNHFLQRRNVPHRGYLLANPCWGNFILYVLPCWVIPSGDLT